MAITIAKIPNRSGFKYKAHVKKNGKNLKIKTFTRKTDARTWAKRIEADFELMEALGCKGSSLTLSQLADEYLDDWSGKDTKTRRLESRSGLQFWGVIISLISPQQ